MISINTEEYEVVVKKVGGGHTRVFPSFEKASEYFNTVDNCRSVVMRRTKRASEAFVAKMKSLQNIKSNTAWAVVNTDTDKVVDGMAFETKKKAEAYKKGCEGSDNFFVMKVKRIKLNGGEIS